MTKLEALRVLIATPRETADDERIGSRVIHAEPDPKVRLRPRIGRASGVGRMEWTGNHWREIA